MKKQWLIIGIILSVIVTILICPVVLLLIGTWESEYYENHWYHTEDISDYGEITHNGKNKIVEEFVYSFFPEQLEDYFNEVEYSYKARDYCDYCCEIYLEFVIEDSELFSNYAAKIKADADKAARTYNVSCRKILSSEKISLGSAKMQDDESRYLSNIERGRVLICEEEHSLIFYAVKVTGCCGTDSNNLDYFDMFS